MNLVDWWREKRAEKGRRQYEQGKAYALGALYSGELAVEHLLARTDAASIFGDFNKFDAGILDGIRQFQDETEHA